MRIIGIDPGSRVTGFGVLDADRDQIKHVHHGVIDVTRLENFPSRVTKVGLELRELFSQFKPTVVVIEQIFLGRNPDSAFKLGHARGIAMYEAQLSGALVVEYSTRLVKKGVTGQGSADKAQVQMALQRLLKMPLNAKFDASDALALAYHHALEAEVQRKMKRMVEV